MAITNFLASLSLEFETAKSKFFFFFFQFWTQLSPVSLQQIVKNKRTSNPHNNLMYKLPKEKGVMLRRRMIRVEILQRTVIRVILSSIIAKNLTIQSDIVRNCKTSRLRYFLTFVDVILKWLEFTLCRIVLS